MRPFFLTLFYFFLCGHAAAQRYIAQPSDFALWTTDWDENLAGPELSQALRSHALNNQEDTSLPVTAVSCSPPPQLSALLGPGQAAPDPTAPIELLKEPAEKLHDVIRVIRSTATGKKLLERFMPKYGYTFKIQQITPEISRKLRFQRPVALYQPSQKALFFDKSQPIGHVAFILLHEIVHCLDNEADNAYRRIMEYHEKYHKLAQKIVMHTSRRSAKHKKDLAVYDFAPADLKELLALKRTIDQMTQIRSFRTERMAYDASYLVWKELAALYPSYYEGAEKKRSLSSLSPIEVSDSSLVQIMRFVPHYIERYQKGLCQRAIP